jgi:hypothetical protein
VPEWVADLIETTSVGDLLSARDALARAGVVSTA